jgi:transposase
MLARTFGCARVVYNDCLRVRDEAHAAGEKISDAEVQRRVVTLAKQTPERAWLGEVASVALVQACQDARRAYRNWFDSLSGKRKGRKIGRPTFRRKHQRQSVRLTRNGFSLHGKRLYVAKVGNIKVEWSRPLPSVPSSVTVIKEADGMYYASFVVEREATPLPVCSPARRKAPRTGPRPGTGSRSCTARYGKPASTTHTRLHSGWSATTKRSTPKTCACPGWPGHAWRSLCMTRDGRSSCG